MPAAVPKPKTKTDEAEANLRGVLYMLDQATGHPSVELLKSIRENVTTALDLIRFPEQDPLLQRLAWIGVSLKESTEIRSKRVKGHDVEYVVILDEEIYVIAMSQLHKLFHSPKTLRTSAAVK